MLWRAEADFHRIDELLLRYGIHNVQDEPWMKMLASNQSRKFLYNREEAMDAASFVFNAQQVFGNDVCYCHDIVARPFKG